MKGACEDCGYTPDDPEYAEDDLVACHGCGKTVCVEDCVWASDNDDRYWCFDCVESRKNQQWFQQIQQKEPTK